MIDVTTLHDEESVNKMSEFTFCVILGYLVQAERALNEDCAGAAKDRVIDAQEAFFDWYEYGKEVSLED